VRVASSDRGEGSFQNHDGLKSKPKQGEQIVRGVFGQTFKKFCQITNNILQITLPKSANFFSLNDLL